MPSVNEAWNEVTHYVVNILSENPDASNEEIEGKIAEDLFDNGYSEDIQNEVLEDIDKLNEIIGKARESKVKEACANIANKLDVIGLSKEADMVDDVIVSIGKFNGMVKQAALFNAQDLMQYANDDLEEKGIDIEQAVVNDMKGQGDDEFIISEFKKWLGRGIASAEMIYKFKEEKHYSYHVFNLLAEYYNINYRLRGK